MGNDAQHRTVVIAPASNEPANKSMGIEAQHRGVVKQPGLAPPANCATITTMKRCFIALAVDDATREALDAARSELTSLAADAAVKIRPVRREGLHLTLKFLGPTPDNQIDDLRAALDAVGGVTPPPPQAPALEGLGAFPTAKRPRALFASVSSHADRIVELAKELEAAMEPLGFEPDGRARKPHVTVARINKARPEGPITDYIADNQQRTWGAIDATTIILYESELSQGGSIYRLLHQSPWDSR